MGFLRLRLAVRLDSEALKGGALVGQGPSTNSTGILLRVPRTAPEVLYDDVKAFCRASTF